MNMPAIELRNLERKLGKFKLGPLNWTVPRGAIYALIGPNGAGKTSTLDLLMGMGRPDFGDIRMLGMELARDEVAIKRKVAYVNPDLNYQPWLTIGNAIDFVRGFYPDWDSVKCDRLLSQFSLARRDRVATLSFGSRIKLSLVLALSRDAELLLLDEPTVGLDVEARLKFFAELLSFMQREDRTIVISSHQLSDLERFADHVAIMNRGALLLAGRMDELVERYFQMDVRIAEAAMPIVGGIRILSRNGDRARIVADRTQFDPETLRGAKVEILSEAPMTLEEMFVALVSAPAGELAA
jgi:ABC-2 type transport system ATP-binding protein